MGDRKNYGGLDYFKLIAAFLIVSIHTSPLTGISFNADYLLTRVIARIAVPFFLMVTGFFILPDYLFSPNRNKSVIICFVKNTLIFYAGAILLYLPIGFYAGLYRNLTFLDFFRLLVFDGTFYHLWYLPACISGVLLLCILIKRFSYKQVVIITFILYLFGLFGDSYFGLSNHIPVLRTVYRVGFYLYTYTRNGLFYTPVFLMMGALLNHSKKHVSRKVCLWGFLLSMIAMTFEGFTLKLLSLQRHDSMYFALLPCMYFGFQFILSFKTQSSKRMRVIAGFIYVLHPLVIILIRGFSKATGLFHILVENSLIHYLLVSLCSFIIAAALSYLLQRGRREEFHYGRAWIELNRNALCHNVNELRTKLPPECELMPAVKADAYGHGAVLIAKELNAMGIKAFCVATVLEGIKLRKNKIKGDILILGYTHPKQFPLLRKYKLIQTVIDYSYANSMNQYGKKFRVHLCIDTGMHRLGERSENINELFDIFKMKNLKIEGIYTHLCSSDSSETEDQIFTNNQGKVFFEVIEKLKLRGIICSKTHILASYGILNYPHLGGNYARVGIALYGILSSKEDVNKSDPFERARGRPSA